MFKFMWMTQRKKLVPILTAFHRAAYTEIMWRFQIRMEIRRIRRMVKLWDEIKTSKPFETKGMLFVKLSTRRKKVEFSAEEKELLSYLKRGRYFF